MLLRLLKCMPAQIKEIGAGERCVPVGRCVVGEFPVRSHMLGPGDHGEGLRRSRDDAAASCRKAAAIVGQGFFVPVFFGGGDGWRGETPPLFSSTSTVSTPSGAPSSSVFDPFPAAASVTGAAGGAAVGGVQARRRLRTGQSVVACWLRCHCSGRGGCFCLMGTGRDLRLGGWLWRWATVIV